MNTAGNLYIVATPIGNLQDITLRAIEILKSVDLIVCEDTRVTGKLLHHLGIKKTMKALNEYNEEQVLYEVLSGLEAGMNIALVSDAGTPLISDPGFRLVRTAREKIFEVIPIPGASAVIAAISASGLPCDKFLFLGFLAKNRTKKHKLLSHLKKTVTPDYRPTIIFYESPHRVVDSLQVMYEVFGDIEIVIARELTKVYEEISKKRVQEWIGLYTEQQPKGEITVLFSPDSK
jgi:16S rRNA (cytidine1402-2'-O)-methyltransferase